MHFMVSFNYVLHFSFLIFQVHVVEQDFKSLYLGSHDKALITSGAAATSSSSSIYFFYCSKTWNGKNINLKMRSFWYLNSLQQCLYMPEIGKMFLICNLAKNFTFSNGYFSPFQSFAIIEEITPHQVQPQRVQKETPSHPDQSLVEPMTMLEWACPILQKG